MSRVFVKFFELYKISFYHEKHYIKKICNDYFDRIREKCNYDNLLQYLFLPCVLLLRVCRKSLQNLFFSIIFDP